MSGLRSGRSAHQRRTLTPAEVEQVVTAAVVEAPEGLPVITPTAH
ncbi:hypothetical protein [Nocardia sp. R7R-8]